MNRLLHCRKYSILLLVLMMFSAVLKAQNYTNGVMDGKIRVKIQPELVANTKGLNVSIDKSIAQSGVANIDKLNTKYSAISMSRVFPYSAKYEARHQKHGLHLWYEITFDSEQIETMQSGAGNPTLNAVKEYLNLGEIELAESIHETKLVQPYTIREADLNAITTNAVGTFSTSDFNDPLLPAQWHYDNYGQTGGVSGMDINLFEAWGIETGSSAVIVSIHDEGVDVNHDDLKDALWVNEAELNGEPNVDDDGNGYKDDIYGFNFSDNIGMPTAGYHGSHVAGTVGATSNNGLGVAGVAGGSGSGDGVRLMTCQILGGSAQNLTPNSYVYAADNGAVISQNSWGYVNPGSYDQAVLDAIDYFIAEAGNYPGSPMKGGVVICAAGNDNVVYEHYPAAYEPCIAVAALGADYVKSSFSNYGEWVDIAAPGGDMDDNVAEDTLSSSILSCYINDGYGYMDGTSQACPHVSGIAALVVSKYGGEDFTAEKLKSHLLTGVRENIYDLAGNADYDGQLGVGASDAVYALDIDYEIAPEPVSDLSVVSVAQDLINLSWTVPADEDDDVPYRFEILHSTEPISINNLDNANSTIVRNSQGLGETFEHSVENLLSITEYYFAVRAIDRWGHVSDLSDVVSGTTSDGPIARLDSTKSGLDISVDVTIDSMGYDSIKLYNFGEGILRWNATTRHKMAEPLSAKPALQYPEISLSSNSYPRGIKSYTLLNEVSVDKIQEENEEEIGYVRDYYYYIGIGEVNPEFTNSSATKFHVGNPEGFNLTNVDSYFQHDPATGPVILEIYSGEDINTAQLVLAQEIEETATGSWTLMELDYHLYFEEGSYFWIVFHVPSGNQYPLVASFEAEEQQSKNCYYSMNLGRTWSMLEEVYYDDRMVWSVFAVSKYKEIGDYVVLDTLYGEVLASDSISINAAVNGSEMINGNYQGQLAINVNETGNPLITLPINVDVTGHLPEIESLNRIDFGSVLYGLDKEVEVEFSNIGLGRFVNDGIEITDPQFEYISGSTTNFEAGTKQTLKFKFVPSGIGNIYADVTLSDANGNDHTLQFFGVGVEPPVSRLEAEADTFNVSTGYSLNIGDTIEGSFTLHNDGNYPLDYFMPAFEDGSNMDNMPEDIHRFGYMTRLDSMGVEPAFIWEDISETGTEISKELIGSFRDNIYYGTEIGFDFPFFGEKQSEAYISRYGVLSFADDGLLWQRMPMTFKHEYFPDRFVSALGVNTSFDAAGFGKVYYQRFMDKFIVQYDSIPFENGIFPEWYLTFQIVLHENGNINIYYNDINVGIYDWGYGWTIDPLEWYSYIAIEDQTKDDGVLIHQQGFANWTYRNGSVIEFINPGYGLYFDVTNTSGTVLPGNSVVIDYKINTDSLNVAEYTEILPIITNDPFNNPLLYSANFELIGGGSPEIHINDTAFDYGQVFQNDSMSVDVILSNTGRATDSILTASFDIGNFRIHGKLPEVLKPGKSLYYAVAVETGVQDILTDTLRISTKGGSNFMVAFDAEIIGGPAITVDPVFIMKAIESGLKDTVQLTVQNSGDYELSFTAKGNNWVSLSDPRPQNQDTLDIDYEWETSLDGNAIYNYMDITETGTKIEGLDGWFGKQWSEGIPLPFSFNFYGVNYDTIYVGWSGLVSFTGNQDGEYVWGGAPIPYPGTPDNYIAGLWLFGGPDWVEIFPKTGQYYQVEEDKVIVEFRDYNSNYVMGDPVSFQVILYANGNIKLQYKMPEHTENFVTQFGTIGIENYDASEGIMISNNTQLVNFDMAISIYPKQVYNVAVGESVPFDVELNATELFAGSYLDDLKLTTNDPNNKNLDVPVRLIVSGEPKIVVPADVVFGDLMVIDEGEESGYKEYIREFQIENTGTAEFLLEEFRQNKASDIIVEAWMYREVGQDFFMWQWDKIFPVDTWDPSIAPLWIKPNTILKMRARIAPEAAMDLTDTLSLITNIGDFRIPIEAEAFMPASITIGDTPIEVYAQVADHKESRSIAIDNSNGGYPLTYDLVVEFDRQEAVNRFSNSYEAVANDHRISFNNLISTFSVAAANSADFDYNRKLAHDNDTVPEGNLGYGGEIPFFSATRFTAPEDGFNLTHVQTWFAPGESLTSEIEVKVFGGSEFIYESTILYEGVYTHEVNEADEAGSLITIPLQDSILMFPNEYFFVVFGYPTESAYPQGTVTGMEEIANRFYYGAGDGQWYDLVGSGYDDYGWMVRAFETEYVQSVWATISSAKSDTILPGASSTIDIDFDAIFANPGINTAKLRVITNDPELQEVEKDLSLHKNQGPIMTTNKSSYRVLEMDTLIIDLVAEDAEGDNFTLALTESHGFTAEEINGSNMTLTCTPGYADQGMKYLLVTGEDEYGNISECSIPVEVINVNREPVANDLGLLKISRLFMDYYSIEESDLFTDPDGDEMTISFTEDTSGIVNVFASHNNFMLTPLELGNTVLTFTAIDEYEGSAVNVVSVEVNENTNGVDEITTDKLNVYPNPTSGKAFITLPDDLEGELTLTVVNSVGQVVYRDKSDAAEFKYLLNIDLSGLASGVYHLELNSADQSFKEKIIIQ